MSSYEKTRTIGQLVTEKPSRSLFFERLGIDYCCGGGITLEEASSKKGLSADQVLQDLERFDAERSQAGRETDWSKSGITQLVDHLLEVHHTYTAEALPRLGALVDKVARVHGENHPELNQVQRVYGELRAELEPHMQKEELVLFPYCKQLDASTSVPQFHCGSISNPINAMTYEHEVAGKLLEDLRRLTHHYTPPADACNSFRAMMDGLAELDRDLHLHIHKENNILFPMVLGKAGSCMATNPF